MKLLLVLLVVMLCGVYGIDRPIIEVTQYEVPVSRPGTFVVNGLGLDENNNLNFGGYGLQLPATTTIGTQGLYNSGFGGYGLNFGLNQQQQWGATPMYGTFGASKNTFSLPAITKSASPMTLPAIDTKQSFGAPGPITAQATYLTNVVPQPMYQTQVIRKQVVQPRLVEKPIVRTQLIPQAVIHPIVHQTVLQPELHTNYAIQPEIIDQPMIQPRIINTPLVQRYDVNQDVQAKPVTAPMVNFGTAKSGLAGVAPNMGFGGYGMNGYGMNNMNNDNGMLFQQQQQPIQLQQQQLQQQQFLQQNPLQQQQF